MADLIEWVIVNVSAYPVTLWNIVFSPIAVFKPQSPNDVCPPSVTFLFSASLLYGVLRVLTSEAKGLQKLLADPKTAVALAATYIAIIANLQMWAMSMTVSVGVQSRVDRLHVLVYAICPTLVLGAALMGLFLLVRKTRLTMFALLILGVTIHVIYVWTLWQASRVAFGQSSAEALIGSLAGWAILAVVGVLWGFALRGVVSRLESNQRVAA
jgi:hypothetical protein